MEMRVQLKLPTPRVQHADHAQLFVAPPAARAPALLTLRFAPGRARGAPISALPRSVCAEVPWVRRDGL
jgi:hypothetical protein